MAATVALAPRDLGAHGIAGVIAGHALGPTVLLRCEVDALPIRGTGDPGWRSEVEDVAHLCGHDGHYRAGRGPPAARRAPRRGGWC